MLKKISSRIQKIQEKKQKQLDKQAEIQLEIDKLDITLKKLNVFKKDYEKLQKNVNEYFESIK